MCVLYNVFAFRFKMQKAYTLNVDEEDNDVKDYNIKPEKIKEILKNQRTSNDYL